MCFHFRKFTADESGAVTVDYVVLTAAIVGLGLASTAAVGTGVGGLGDQIRASLTGANVAQLQFAAYEFRVMTEGVEHWNNITSRRNQMAGMTDERLQWEWEHYVLHYFALAIEEGNNSVCDGCRGAGNRLDLMRIVLDEKASRGIATSQDHQTMADSIAMYNAQFGT